MGDWESYRIVTRVRRRVRGLVFEQAGGGFYVRIPLGPYAAKVSMFDSMKKLESFVRNRAWRLEKVRHFA